MPITWFQSSVISRLAVFQNAFDEYAHGPFRRVLAADYGESQPFFSRALFQYERVKRAKRRPGTPRQRAERRAIRFGESLAVSSQVHGGHVVFGIGLALRRRYVHDGLSVFVVLLDGRRATVLVVHRSLQHPLLQQWITAVATGFERV